ncbi:hypothetical protein IG631_24039, partial [Alternaria alternata]
RENDAIRDYYRATALQRSSRTSDYYDKSCYLTTANRGDLAGKRDNLNAANCAETVKVRPLVESETFFGVASVVKGPPTPRKRSHQSLIANAATTILEAVPNIISHLEPENLHSAKRRRIAKRQAQSSITRSTYTPKPPPLLDPSH